MKVRVPILLPAWSQWSWGRPQGSFSPDEGDTPTQALWGALGCLWVRFGVLLRSTLSSLLPEPSFGLSTHPGFLFLEIIGFWSWMHADEAGCHQPARALCPGPAFLHGDDSSSSLQSRWESLGLFLFSICYQGLLSLCSCLRTGFWSVQGLALGSLKKSVFFFLIFYIIFFLLSNLSQRAKNREKVYCSYEREL